MRAEYLTSPASVATNASSASVDLNCMSKALTSDDMPVVCARGIDNDICTFLFVLDDWAIVERAFQDPDVGMDSVDKGYTFWRRVA